MSDYRLSDLLDLTILQKMADAHYRAAGMPIGIIDAIDGSILVGSGWQDICAKFHRTHPVSLQRCRESDNFIKDRLVEGKACHYKCKNGLWDIGVPIVLAGHHLATMFLGQFFYEEEAPDREFFIQLAHEFGFDVDEYLVALDLVPIFSHEKVDYILEYDKALVNFIADIAEQSLLKIKADEIIRESERKFHAIFDHAYQFLGLLSIDGRVLEANRTALRFSGIEEADVIGKPFWETPWWAHSPELREEVRLAVQKAAKGEFIRFEPTQPAADGSLHHFDFSLKPVKDEAGKVVLLIPEGRDITERKQAEKALRLSEVRHRTLVATIPDLVWLKDMNGVYLSCNPTFERFFGAKEADIVGRTDYDFNDKALADFFRENDRKAIAAGGPIVNEEKLTFADNGYCGLFETIKTPMRDAQGHLIGVLGISRDITERKRAEEERKAHIRFLETLERIDQAIKQETDVEQMLSSIIKTVFSTFDCDRAWLLYPCDPDAPTFRVPVEITRPEYPGAKILNMDVPMSPNEARNMREALESDDPVIYTTGTEHPISTAEQFGVQSQMFVPVYPKLGKPWVFGMHQCSYPRIWTKEEKKLFKEISRRIADGLSGMLSFRELQEKEERFRATFEQAAVGIAHISPNGRWLRVNQKLCDIVGYSKEELLQKTFQNLTYAEDLDAYQEYVRQVLAGEIPTYGMEKRCIRKDGSLVWTNLTVSIVRNASGDPTYSISVIEDITKRKRGEEERKRLEEQLFQAQKMESVGRLAGGVAHDFNNMLGVIIGRAEMALDVVGRTDPLRESFQEILKAANRSADITRQLLAFARKQTVSPRILDLNDSISGLFKMLRRLIGEDIDLAWMPGHNLWKIRIDSSQIDQILANLVVNSRDAISGTGSITLKTENVVVDESCRPEAEFIAGEYVLLTMSDTGAGMDNEVLDHIFEPFFTTKEVGKGTGLGLSTIYGIVKQNDGFIYAYSTPGRGTTFKTYLPRFKEENAQTLEGTVAVRRLQGGSETILLAEDDEPLLGLAKTILQSLGYTVLAARTPQEAIRLVENYDGDIHMLVTDVVMPEMNGRELVERLRAIRPDLKCLYMSGYTADIIAHRGILDDEVNFINKPFGKKKFALRIREVLEQQLP
ncbi:MAG: PAS domain S-box protein [Syntrophobacteraceae bacterium]